MPILTLFCNIDCLFCLYILQFQHFPCSTQYITPDCKPCRALSSSSLSCNFHLAPCLSWPHFATLTASFVYIPFSSSTSHAACNTLLQTSNLATCYHYLPYLATSLTSFVCMLFVSTHCTPKKWHYFLYPDSKILPCTSLDLILQLRLPLSSVNTLLQTAYLAMCLPILQHSPASCLYTYCFNTLCYNT